MYTYVVEVEEQSAQPAALPSGQTTLPEVAHRLGWSRAGLDQLFHKPRKEWIRMIRRDPNWEEVKSLRGHPRFLNRRLPWPDNVINIHFDPHRREPGHLLKQRLAALGWTEEHARSMGYIH